jgi:drug/metabolite transporter (DMT)-like permease
VQQIDAPSRPTLFNWIEIFGLGVIWGASFLTMHLALDGFAPFTVAAGRITLAALALGLLCFVRGLPLPSWHGNSRIWVFAIGMGVFSNVVPFSLLAWAQQHVTSGFAGVSMAMVPLFTLVLAHFLLPGERMTLQRMAGFALGLVGVVLLLGTESLASGGAQLEPVARIVCVLATLSYAIGSMITRRCPPVDPIAFSTLALIASAVTILPLALLVDGPPVAMPPLHALASLVYLGLLPTALATLILVHVIRTAGPTFLTQTNYHVPIWSVIFGTLLLAEPLPPQFLLALGLILSGLMVSRITIRKRQSAAG